MIVLHHLNHSRSQRILWLLEEMELPYEIQHYARNRQTMLAPPELMDVHPLGKSPVITDNDVTIAESGAIIEYLIELYGGGGFKPEPSDTQPHRDYVYWMHYAEGSVMPLLLVYLLFDYIESRKMIFPLNLIAKGASSEVNERFLRPNLDRHFGYVDDYLSTHEWFAGDCLTGADVQMIFPLEAAASSGVWIDNNKFPCVVDYVKRIQSRSAYQRALRRAGSYRHILS